MFHRRFLKVYLSIIPIFFFLFSHPVIAAEAKPPDTRPANSRIIAESSVISGFGTGHIAEGHYTPALLIWHVGMDVERLFPQLKHRGHLFLFLEPQFNPVTRPETDFEAGMGMGIQYMYPFSERFSAYILASTGLQYISVVTEDQANRLNFSDLVGCGLYYFFSKHSAVNIGYRFRHISNTGLAMPNGGINTQFMTVGYSMFF